MGFKDFAQGQTPQQAQYFRQQEQEKLLNAEFEADEMYLKVLRPVEANTPKRQDIFLKWKDSRIARYHHEGTDWWSSTFHESVLRYGPVLLGKSINAETVAASLQESPAGVVYSSHELGFFFKDYSVDAYRPVSEGRLSALVKRIAIEACRHSARSEGEQLLQLRDLSEIVVSTAKVILEVEADFFRGQGAARRYAAGQYKEPVEAPLCKIFLDEQIVREDTSVLKLGDVYHRYYEFCYTRSVDALSKAVFRKTFNHETKSRYGVGIRNDLRSPSGVMFQGWEGLEFANAVIGRN
jgi:hypothetical protein